ncbi:MAG TPA: prepilin peptidase [Candidatus Saccharimonadales bacterium]|nr:prepilin peptidase [Candidatus Saccharimonadales bacterium]
MGDIFIFSIVFFLFGLLIGSFLNVLIDRIPQGISVIKGRSRCDSCHRILQWFDLFPVFSFLFLRGKCRYCHKKIGWQTFIIEILTGIIFAATAFTLLTHVTSLILLAISLLYTLFILSCFIVITVIDIKHGIIPNVFVYPSVILSVGYHLLFFSTALPYFLSAIGAGGFFLCLFIITKGRGMGFGDVKLAVLLGFFLGFPYIIIALYIAFLTGALVAFILVLGKKKKFSGGTIPFGPFLIAGALLAFFYGDFLWNHVLKMFFNI